MGHQELKGGLVICRDSDFTLSVRSVESGRRICWIYNSDAGREHAEQILRAFDGAAYAGEVFRKCETYLRSIEDRHAGIDALLIECESARLGLFSLPEP